MGLEPPAPFIWAGCRFARDWLSLGVDHTQAMVKQRMVEGLAERDGQARARTSGRAFQTPVSGIDLFAKQRTHVVAALQSGSQLLTVSVEKARGDAHDDGHAFCERVAGLLVLRNAAFDTTGIEE